METRVKRRIHITMSMRRMAASAAGLLIVVVAISAVKMSLSSPIALHVVRTEGSGVLDVDGREMWLAYVTVSNLQAGALEFEWGSTEAEARVNHRWIRREISELLLNPGHLEPHAKRELLILIPQTADSCRIRLRYQPELLQWRIWHYFGASGQRWVGKFPKLANRMWPAGNYGERPPWGKGFRKPPNWRSFIVELRL